MRYCEFDPATELRPWVANYWALRIAPSAGAVTHVVPPDGCVNIACSTRLAVVVGPQTAPLSPPVKAGDQWFGARLNPGAARALLGIPRSLQLRNAAVQATTTPSLSWLLALPGQLASTTSDPERLELMNELLRTRLKDASPPDDIVAEAVRLMVSSDEVPAIGTLSAQLGVSARQLHRRFVASADLSPSEFRAIWRLRRCLVAMVAGPESRWSRRAASNGYADQSHLTREFRRLIGVTPRRFARQTSTISHGELRFPDPDSDITRRQ